jgi:hypothetical protein
MTPVIWSASSSRECAGRLARTSLAISAVLVWSCGCTSFDPSGIRIDDAFERDAAQDLPDACTGHICPGPGVPVYTLPETGIMRTELFHVGNDADGTRQELLGSWFFAFDGQQPAARGILGPAITDIGTPDDFNCFDNTAHNVLVNGYSAENQAIVDTRNYYDVGPSVTITPQGGGAGIEMARTMDGADPTNQLIHDWIYLSDSDAAAAAALQRNVAYDLPVLAPDDATGFPGLDLYAGFDVPGAQDFTDRTPSLYMPANFTMNNPTETAFYDGLVVDRDADLIMEWANGEAPPADAPVVAQFTAFASVDGDGRPTIEYICVGAAAGETHTIPSALFAKTGFPEAGLMLHGQLQHVAWAARNASPGNNIDPENPDDGNFHFFGVNCNLHGYSLSPLP